jgi:hypothetical protein
MLTEGYFRGINHFNHVRSASNVKFNNFISSPKKNPPSLLKVDESPFQMGQGGGGRHPAKSVIPGCGMPAADIGNGPGFSTA